MKRSFFHAAVMSILLYGCSTWTLIKRLEKKLDGSYTRMLRAILNKSWWQHPTRHQLYGHLPPITKTVQVRWTRHAGHCWRSRDELISDVLQWTPTYSRAKAGWPGRTYIQQLCEDMGCSREDLPDVMNDRKKWRERVRDIHAGGTTWWYIYYQLNIIISHLINYFSIHCNVKVFSKRNNGPYLVTLAHDSFCCGLNSLMSLFYTGCPLKLESLVWCKILFIAEERKNGFMPFQNRM